MPISCFKEEMLSCWRQWRQGVYWEISIEVYSVAVTAQMSHIKPDSPFLQTFTLCPNSFLKGVNLSSAPGDDIALYGIGLLHAYKKEQMSHIIGLKDLSQPR